MRWETERSGCLGVDALREYHPCVEKVDRVGIIYINCQNLVNIGMYGISVCSYRVNCS